MNWVDVGQEATGFLAIGQEATGVVAIGQSATGVIAIGQFARGVIAVGQTPIGVVVYGLVAAGLLWAGGLLAIAPFSGWSAVGIGLFGRIEQPEGEPRRRFVLSRPQSREGWAWRCGLTAALAILVAFSAIVPMLRGFSRLDGPPPQLAYVAVEAPIVLPDAGVVATATSS